jgi:alkaline phosphatase
MKLSLVALLLVLVIFAKAQPAGHSHNDYYNESPFFTAYNQHFGSIEADVWAIDGILFVAHDREEITPERTLEELYILPIVKVFRENSGKAWPGSVSTFQLMVDMKTEAEPALSLLVKLLEQYPEVFDTRVNKNAVKVVISGNRPIPEDYRNYPPFIWFDGRLSEKYTKSQLKRIGMISDNFTKYSSWKGEGPMSEADRQKIARFIGDVHKMKKKIRFWATPDNENAWQTLYKMNVDFINTDHIEKLSEFLQSLN